MNTSVSLPDSASKDAFGAVVLEHGVFFRVWAPNADAVSVEGTFNDWSKDSHPMENEGNGCWAAHVEEAKPGDEYKFVIRSGEQVLERNDPFAREMTNSAGNSVVYQDTFDWEGDAFEAPPVNELVIYELHVGSFNVKKEGRPGTFKSLIERLDHLVELGVNAIELMPVAEFPGGFSWGYNLSHPFAVESDYGGPDALKELVKQAHQKGIAVILDVVYNHFGPSDLDLWQFDGWEENGKGGIYFFNDWRSKTPWGDTRPDYGREEVRNYLLQNAIFWMESFHMDGMRWDATSFISAGDGSSSNKDIPEGWEFMKWANGELRKRFPKCILIAEDLQDDAAVTQSPEDGGAGFHAQWDCRFVHPIRNELILPSDDDRNLSLIADAIEHTFNGDPFQRVIYTESHDEVANGKQRLPQEITNDDVDDWFAMKRSMLGALLVMTSPGIPMILQGQEFLEDEWFRDDDPLEWQRKERFNGIFCYYRDLIHLRRNLSGVSGGLLAHYLHIFHVHHENKVLAFQRASSPDAEDHIIVIANFSNRTHESYRIGFPQPGTWHVRLNNDSSIYSEQFQNLNAEHIDVEEQPYDGMPYSHPVNIGPYSALIYSRG